MRVIVAGTFNVDYLLTVEALPRVGETTVGTSLERFMGGKGVNQASMCANLGAEVYICGCVGTDSEGANLIRGLESLGIDCRLVERTAREPTGISFITADVQGRNMIMSYSGANAVSPVAQVEAHKDVIRNTSAMLLHAELPMDLLDTLIGHASEHGIATFLTPAPPSRVTPRLLSRVDVILPNETEAETLTEVPASGMDEISEMGRRLVDMGPRLAVVTLGERGAHLSLRLDSRTVAQRLIPAFPVESVVDTTAAGDSFCAAFAWYLGKAAGEASIRKAIEDLSAVSDAARFAASVAAIVVSRRGALPSLPKRWEVRDFLAASEPRLADVVSSE